MPLYEYECEACGQRFEVIRKFSDPPLDVCTLCGKGPVSRLQSSPAIQFKGSGWYITDYARNKGDGDKKREGGKGEGGASDKTSAEQRQTDKSDASSSEASKTDAKSDTAAKSESSTPAKADGTAKKD